MNDVLHNVRTYKKVLSLVFWSDIKRTSLCKVVLWLMHKCKVSRYTSSNESIDTTEVIRHAYIKYISLGKERLTSKVNNTFFRVLPY